MDLEELTSTIKSFFVKIEWLKVLLATIVAVAVALVCKIDVAPPKGTIISVGIFLIVFAVVLVMCKEKFVCGCFDSVANWTFLSTATIEKIFLIIYGIYMAFTISGHCTMVTGSETIHSIVTMCRFATMAVAMAIVFIRYIKREYSKRDLFIIAGVTILVLIITFTSKDYDPVKYWLFIIAAFGVDLRKIVKVSCIAHIIMIPSIVLLSLNETAGMLNLVYEQGDRVRQSLGFGYTTIGSILWMYTIFMWLYWRREKARLWEHIMLAAIAVFFYFRTDTRSSFVLSMLAIVISIVLKMIPKLRKCNKFYTVAAIVISIVFPLGIIAVSFWGNAESQLFVSVNALLNGRLQLGQSGFQYYGVTLFGQQIDWSGRFLEDGTYVYNYVDSSYVRMLLNYGAIFATVIIAYFVIVLIRAGKKKDTYLLAALSMVIVHATFDPQLIYIEYNAFAMALSYVLIKNREISQNEDNMMQLMQQ